jgi:hypothetical protein
VPEPAAPVIAELDAADAVHEAVRDAGLSPLEMQTMLAFLCGYTPAGVHGALKMIKEARHA